MKANFTLWVDAVQSCIQKHIKTGETELLSHAVTLLATHGWERSESSSFGHPALEAVCQRFSVPLEHAGVNLSLVLEEWDDMVEYGKQYLNLVQQDYQTIWWKLYNAVDSKKWSNILSVVELLFCLPMANGHLERVFSQLKLIKNNRRTSFNEDTLDQLLRINLVGPPLADWDATGAIELWWREKKRRVSQKDTGTSSASATAAAQNDKVLQPSSFDWEEWEQWIGADD